jgi:peroxiredoxin
VSRAATVASRWAGRVLVAALGVLLGLNLVLVRRNWSAIARVTTPPGSDAPDFTVPLLDGGTLHLAGERGHPVVLAFWASWCEPCMAELPGVDRVSRRLTEAPHRARLYAVNIEGDFAAARGARQKLGLTLPIAVDEGGVVADAYRVQSIPHAVLLDGAGRVAAVLRGPQREDELLRAIESLEQRDPAPAP